MAVTRHKLLRYTLMFHRRFEHNAIGYVVDDGAPDF